MKKIISLLLILTISISVFPSFAAKQYFSDISEGSWYKSSVNQAYEANIMKGPGDGTFGVGKTLSRSEFATILCNMMKWQPISPAKQSFSDVSKDVWYFSYIETALDNSAFDKSDLFYPSSPITREEMAVMLVRSLGLSACAKAMENEAMPFTDVVSNKGYICVAKDIGMTDGTSPTTFSPKDTATREQCAAMIMRIYNKFYGKTQYTHGFYAISSFSQKEFIANTDATTLLWSTMTIDDTGIWLNTENKNSNQFKIPDSYKSITDYLDVNKEKTHLGIFMDISKGLDTLISTPANRTKAVSVIMEELNKVYSDIGKNPYSGITIDFEGLRKSQKDNFSAFIGELSRGLKSQEKTLYVTVQPALADGYYFDGYDYKVLGEYADKIILMAHDYNPGSLDGFIGSKYHQNAAITPIASVYYALKAVTDKNTGVADTSKIALAISFSGIGWQVDENGNLLSVSPVTASSETIYEKMKLSSAKKGFSDFYRNPYLTYTNPDGKSIFLWYEDEQSVFEKAALARFFNVYGISLWRLGNLPLYDGFNITNSIK